MEIDESLGWLLTDDTSLTLATCEAIVERGAVDPAAIAERCAVWFREGRIHGIGASTYKALSEIAAGGHWALCGRKGEKAAGNGAAMRIAPLAFCLDPQDADARRTIRDVSRITHHHEEAYAGALAIVVAVRAAWEGRWTGGPLLRDVAEVLPDRAVRDRMHEIAEVEADELLGAIATRFGCSGFVVDSVPMALCGAGRIGQLGFERLMIELVRCGGDTDTIASMAGQVAGTYLGYNALPKAMVERLPERDRVVAVAELLADVVAGL